MMDMGYTDWQHERAKRLYVSGSCRTLRAVERVAGIPMSTLGRWSSEEGWGDAREKEQLRLYHLGKRANIAPRVIEFARSRLEAPRRKPVPKTVEGLTPENKRRALAALARIKGNGAITLGLALIKETRSMDGAIVKKQPTKRALSWQP